LFERLKDLFPINHRAPRHYSALQRHQPLSLYHIFIITIIIIIITAQRPNTGKGASAASNTVAQWRRSIGRG